MWGCLQWSSIYSKERLQLIRCAVRSVCRSVTGRTSVKTRGNTCTDSRAHSVSNEKSSHTPTNTRSIIFWKLVQPVLLPGSNLLTPQILLLHLHHRLIQIVILLQTVIVLTPAHPPPPRLHHQHQDQRHHHHLKMNLYPRRKGNDWYNKSLCFNILWCFLKFNIFAFDRILSQILDLHFVRMF